MILLGNGAERPLLEKPVRFLVLNDDSDTWGHGKRVYADVAGSFALESSAVSEGPVVSKLFQRFAWGHSRLEVIHSLYAGLPEVRIELVVYWAEHRKILKMEMLPGGRSPVIHMQAPGGWVERRTDGAELPLHHALLVPGTEPPFGLVQTGAFACDCDGGRLRITLVRSSLYGYDQGQKLNPADPQRETDQGEHRFRLCLLSRPGLSAESLDREALAFTEPFPVIRESGASG